MKGGKTYETRGRNLSAFLISWRCACLQVYKGLDVATNKATEEETDGVPHHMMGTVDLGDECNVHGYKDEALKIVSFLCCVYVVLVYNRYNWKKEVCGSMAPALIKNLLFLFKQQVSNEVLLLNTLHGVNKCIRFFPHFSAVCI